MSDSMADEIAEFEARLNDFRESAQGIEGPIGSLLRTIAWVQQQFAEAADRHGVTDGEAARLVCVVDEAIAVADWLRLPPQAPPAFPWWGEVA